MTKVSAQTFARGYKNVFSWKKLYIDFLILLTENILQILKRMILIALVNSVNSTEVFKIQRHPSEVFLEKTYARGIGQVKLKGLGLQLYQKKQTPTQVFSCELC